MISPLFLEIETALKNGQSFEITSDETIKKFDQSSWISQILFSCLEDKNTLSSRFIKNAVMITDYLIKAPRAKGEKLCELQHVVSSVKLFLKTHQFFQNTSAFNKCSLELLALRLGIDSAILKNEKNSGFTEFAETYHLYNSLMTFNHDLYFDKETSEILIPYQNKLIPWSEAKEIVNIFLAKFQKETLLNEPYSLCLYGDEGLIYKNRYSSSKITPLLKGDTSNWSSHFIKNPLIFDKFRKGYLLEFCSTAIEETPTFVGQHTWTRIYKFNKTIGKMYSIGLYRPYKHNSLFDSLWFPFCKKNGYLTDCEISEVWNMNLQIKTVAVRINEEIYKKIKKKINDDRFTNNVTYHHITQNCAKYSNDLAKMAGFDLKTKQHIVILFSGIHLLNAKSRALSRQAQVVQFLSFGLIYALTPVFNMISYLAGSGLISLNVKYSPEIRPVLGLLDFFKVKKLKTHSPWILSQTTKSDVENWRQSELDKLPDNLIKERKQKELAFAFPPDYHLI